MAGCRPTVATDCLCRAQISEIIRLHPAKPAFYARITDLGGLGSNLSQGKQEVRLKKHSVWKW